MREGLDIFFICIGPRGGIKQQELPYLVFAFGQIVSAVVYSALIKKINVTSSQRTHMTEKYNTQPRAQVYEYIYLN